MELDPKTCYRAVLARDPRWDGQFFTGVVTTGIFCRPICPARTPLFKNVQFYPTAAAAIAAGFRPCRRCRPETAPGTPPWRGTSSTVARALKLIAAGALARGSVEQLADRLGVGSRHLRRLFRGQLGSSPQAVERLRRAQVARRLVDSTGMRMADVAHESGYGSIRQFNAAMRKVFGHSPTKLRRRHAQQGART